MIYYVWVPLTLLLCLWREPDVTNGALISIWPPHYALFTCLSSPLYLLRQNQGFHWKSVTQFCYWAVKVSITFALQDFSNNLSMQKQEGGKRCSTPQGRSHSQTLPSRLWSPDSCLNPQRWQKEVWTKVTGKSHSCVKGGDCCVGLEVVHH